MSKEKPKEKEETMKVIPIHKPIPREDTIHTGIKDKPKESRDGKPRG